jgi:hypothetical protein
MDIGAGETYRGFLRTHDYRVMTEAPEPLPVALEPDGRAGESAVGGEDNPDSHQPGIQSTKPVPDQ